MHNHLGDLFRVHRDLIRMANSLGLPFTCRRIDFAGRYDNDELESTLSDLEASGLICYQRKEGNPHKGTGNKRVRWEVTTLFQ